MPRQPLSSQVRSTFPFRRAAQPPNPREKPGLRKQTAKPIRPRLRPRPAGLRQAGILSAHTAEEIICVVSFAAATGPQAVAVALAVVADALRAGDPLRSPSR